MPLVLFKTKNQISVNIFSGFSATVPGQPSEEKPDLLVQLGLGNRAGGRGPRREPDEAASAAGPARGCSQRSCQVSLKSHMFLTSSSLMTLKLIDCEHSLAFKFG